MARDDSGQAPRTGCRPQREGLEQMPSAPGAPSPSNTLTPELWESSLPCVRPPGLRHSGQRRWTGTGRGHVPGGRSSLPRTDTSATVLVVRPAFLETRLTEAHELRLLQETFNRGYNTQLRNLGVLT